DCMPLPAEVLTEVQTLLRKPSDWFSTADIKECHPHLFAAEFIQKTTGKCVSFPRDPSQVYRDLEAWAAGLLEREVRKCESRMEKVFAENSASPFAENEKTLVHTLTQYIKDAVNEVTRTDLCIG